ncbi:stemmadenine O-acetyltransferase [Ziziphus jujuba]|uniref:Stemmadenine O-acetyltransferase n=2 Tax=Ziziphus jujuba TaxID=326968 RepID=A0A6P4A1X6_ZIZJJ|nr:stemmadenine O-acetyltransferase [Ziziphus jujuba]KAH7521759.1 hypothetical protein FEM48_Zijuj07G0066500 [Ziziphus jujuba var. spinosa]
MVAIDMKVQIIHRETIKPSSPTPHHLKTHKLCLVDQLAPVMYVPLLLFYPNSNGLSISEKTKLLRNTLSQTLTLFYPLAGRISTDFSSIDCNDNGAEFIEAKTNCKMAKIMEKPDEYYLRQFLAAEPESKEASKSYLLLVQATFFQCGGMVIGLSFSHNAMDAASLSTFLNTWSAIALESGEFSVPEFGAGLLLPPADLSNNINSEPPSVELVHGNFTTRRFVFEPEKIASLQSIAASEKAKNPTRVEAVCALIWKSAIQASRSNRGNSVRPSVFCQTMNLRWRTIPPLAKNIIGNLVANFTTVVEESEIDLENLVAKLREGIEEVKESYGRGLDVKEVQKALEKCGNLIKKDGIDNYNCTSWCRFPFYKADFGWGKPDWVSICKMEFKNFVFMIDTKDGDGIEAWLILSEEDMELVERNQELLAFALLNPSIT